jgi:hypothetical protein
MSNMFVLAQDDAAAAAAAGIIGLMFLFVYFTVALLTVAGQWKVFSKAGRPGWAVLIPFYGPWLLVEIVGKPPMWFFLLLVPCVNIVIGIMLLMELAKCFGKDAAYGLGLAFLCPIFWPMLGFGSAQYVEPPPPE